MHVVDSVDSRVACFHHLNSSRNTVFSGCQSPGSGFTLSHSMCPTGVRGPRPLLPPIKLCWILILDMIRDAECRLNHGQVRRFFVFHAKSRSQNESTLSLSLGQTFSLSSGRRRTARSRRPVARLGRPSRSTNFTAAGSDGERIAERFRPTQVVTTTFSDFVSRRSWAKCALRRPVRGLWRTERATGFAYFAARSP